LKKNLISFLVRPYIAAELPGWGKVYNAFVGGYKKNGEWAEAGPTVIRDKRNGMHRIVDLREWADRSLFFLRRWYDLEAALLIEHIVKPGDHLLDVGANYGHFTMAAAAAVGSKGSVISVEPNPTAHARLVSHVALNGLEHVQTEQMGLSNEPGELILSVPLINSGEASFASSQYENVRRVVCPVRTGDSLLEGRNVDFIKIDVEGYELNVLKGLQDTLNRCSPIILTEVVEAHLARAGTSGSEVQNYLSSRGYKAYQIGLRKAGFKFYLELTYRDRIDEDCDILWIPEKYQSRIEQIAVRNPGSLRVETKKRKDSISVTKLSENGGLRRPVGKFRANGTNLNERIIKAF